MQYIEVKKALCKMRYYSKVPGPSGANRNVEDTWYRGGGMDSGAIKGKLGRGSNEEESLMVNVFKQKGDIMKCVIIVESN